jgi:methyl-accepting chemotaxis protein
MKQKKKLVKGSSIRFKLILITSIILIVPLLNAGFVSFTIAKQELNQKGEIILKNAVKQAMYLIDAKQAEIEKGTITLEEAQESVKTYLLGPMDGEGKRAINKNIDLGRNGYFVVYDDTGLEVMHPSLEGQNVWDVEDKSGNGFKFVREQIHIASNGGGFVHYTWTLPNSDQFGEKISYQEKDPHWGWIVSAGSYMSDYNEGANSMLQVVLIIVFVSIVIGLAIIFIFASRIVAPIRKISTNLDEVSKGNLKIDEIKINSKDETEVLAASFNIMLRNMKTLIGTMKDSSTTVVQFSKSLANITDETSRAISEVATTIQEVAQAVGDEAANTENAVGRVNILAKSIETVTNSAQVMDHIADETGELSDKGIKAVETLIQTTEKNNTTTAEISDVITKVGESSKKINVITETITGISEQTNLLALNASIEAARAGEAGRGFAVVADEIRKLAEQSGKAVQEIKEIINEIHRYSNTSVETMELVKQVTKEQNAAVEDTKQAFTDISNIIKDLILRVDEINKESTSMSERKNEIVDIMSNISASTQETSAATEEVSASSEEQLAQMEEVLNHANELKSLSENLNQAVDQFII